MMIFIHSLIFQDKFIIAIKHPNLENVFCLFGLHLSCNKGVNLDY